MRSLFRRKLARDAALLPITLPQLIRGHSGSTSGAAPVVLLAKI